MARKRTYEGRVGRVIGFLHGSFFLSIGTLLSTILIVRGDLFSRNLQDTIADLVPWLQGNPSGVIGTEGALAGGLVIVFCLGYGLYHIGRVFLVSDYSITIGSSSSGGGPT